MTNEFALRTLLIGAAAGALICAIPVSGAVAQGAGAPAAGSATTGSTTDAAAEQKALDAIMSARQAAQQHKIRAAIEEIERAEVALLNREAAQQPDPHVDVALKQLDAARDAISRKDISATEQQLAEAATLLTVASNAPPTSTGSSMPPQRGAATASMTTDQARQMMGQQVYDSDNVDIGPVVDIMLDDDGTPASIIIGVAGPADGGATTVAVPMSDVQSVNNRPTVDRTKAQLRQAASYRTQGTGTSGSSSQQTR
jgi:sporulation protein YlmC with PRC-barrel domain